MFPSRLFAVKMFLSRLFARRRPANVPAYVAEQPILLLSISPTSITLGVAVTSPICVSIQAHRAPAPTSVTEILTFSIAPTRITAPLSRTTWLHPFALTPTTLHIFVEPAPVMTMHIPSPVIRNDAAPLLITFVVSPTRHTIPISL